MSPVSLAPRTMVRPVSHALTQAGLNAARDQFQRR
jgi:hypothetical protein